MIDTVNSALDVPTKYIIGERLDMNSVYTFVVSKITEADYNNPNPTFNSVVLNGFDIDTGVFLKPKIVIPARKIEFIGDSITAGYCNLCHRMAAGYADYVYESFASSWPTLVAASLNASLHASAWSGFGLVR